MTDEKMGASGGKRHWVVDAVLGGAMALVAITVAQAALPHRDEVRPSVKPAPQPAPIVAAPEPVVLIAFRDPLPGYEVGSPFGMRKMPWEEGGRLHAGVDIAAPSGSAVLAAADGVVTRIGRDGGYGRFVELKHAEGLSTLYGHLGGYPPGVKVGMAVKAGTKVGLIGSTGTSTGDHLHFEIHDPKGRPMNPQMFLGRSFATLEELPLKEARRAPRGVRVAYVSRIPKNKQAAMQAKVDARAEKIAARKAKVRQQAALDAAADAGAAGRNVSATAPVAPIAVAPAGELQVAEPRPVAQERPRAQIQL